MTTLRPVVPPLLDRVVKECLHKDADHRWQTARDLLDELTWIAEGETAVAPVGAHTRNPWRERAAGITAAAGVLIALAIGLAVGGRYMSTVAAPAALVRLEMQPPADVTLAPAPVISTAQLALSPDGASSRVRRRA